MVGLLKEWLETADKEVHGGKKARRDFILNPSNWDAGHDPPPCFDGSDGGHMWYALRTRRIRPVQNPEFMVDLVADWHACLACRRLRLVVGPAYVDAEKHVRPPEDCAMFHTAEQPPPGIPFSRFQGRIFYSRDEDIPPMPVPEPYL